MAPLEIKGRPWLQIRQSDVCEANGLLEEPRTLPFATPDNENELMQGDDPNVYTGGDASVEDKNDELGGEFMPVIDRRAKRTDGGHPAAEAHTADEINGDLDDISDDDYDDGSGATFRDADEDPSTTVPTASVFPDEVYEGSGDDEAHARGLGLNDEVETTTAANETNADGESSTVAAISPVGSGSENVEHSAEPDREETTPPSLLPVVEERIVKVDATNVDTELIHPDLVDEPAVHTEGNTDNSSLSSSAPIRSDANEQASAGFSNTNSAYILLAILGIILILLVVFVATKRSRTVAKNRRDNDIEQHAQELAEMDKNNLGKPIAEFIPLIPGRYPVDKENNLCNAQEPLLKKLTESDAESNPSANESQEEPKIDEETKQQNGTKAPDTPPSTPIQNGIHKDDNDGHVFPSISPKPSRYSPVSWTGPRT